MKNFSRPVLLLIMASVICSCDSYMDTHKEYIKNGELRYAVKLDSLAVYSGKERVVLGCWLYNAVFVDSIFVYWNSRKDTLAVPVSMRPGLDSIEVNVPDLGESAFTFEVRTKDRFGDWSLFTTGTGASYGEEFQSSLSNRTVINALIQNGNGIIKWGSADETLLCTEFKYSNTYGEEVRIKTPSDEAQTFCEGIDINKDFAYRSLYIPQESAVDTFSTSWSSNVIFSEQLDRTGWEINNVSSELSGYLASSMLDGNISTFWHTLYGAGAPPLPHIITVDMKADKTITGLDIYQRAGSHQTKSFKLYLSGDNVDWDYGGSFTFLSNTIPSMECMLYKPFACRYIRFEFFESFNADGSCAIAEVYFYGEN